MNISTVNELIQSLESAGELSIREQKFLKLAKAYQQLAAENVEAKKIISECREYFIAGVMNRIRPTNEGYLHMICDTFADETPATDRIVAGIKADGVEMFALMFAEEAIKDNNITTGWKARASRAASEYAELLREGAGK
ncbi:hypothetical protein KI741_10325 [Klebsiella pneumoniae]|nr:hypothetical protein [Klebsiella pneumoniae]QVQ93688.1 hypothetical protein KI741_10325 [Klebsiella pneumoniae]